MLNRCVLPSVFLLSFCELGENIVYMTSNIITSKHFREFQQCFMWDRKWGIRCDAWILHVFLVIMAVDLLQYNMPERKSSKIIWVPFSANTVNHVNHAVHCRLVPSQPWTSWLSCNHQSGPHWLHSKGISSTTCIVVKEFLFRCHRQRVFSSCFQVTIS